MRPTTYDKEELNLKSHCGLGWEIKILFGGSGNAYLSSNLEETHCEDANDEVGKAEVHAIESLVLALAVEGIDDEDAMSIAIDTAVEALTNNA